MRIALVAEGPTDGIIIEAALKAIVDRPFVLTQLQPEATQPNPLGTGWGGVLKWCLAFRGAGYGALEDDPKLAGFDLLILHLDADVADKSYADYGPQAVQLANTAALPQMPFAQPCPPSSATVVQVEALVSAWLGILNIGARTVFCIPSKSIEAWLAAALLTDKQDLMNNIECEPNIQGILANLPKPKRVRKTGPAYLRHASVFVQGWADCVKVHCSQALGFEQRILSALQE